MRAFAILVATGLGLGLPGLVTAQSFSGAEHIVRGDLVAAEREIAQERRLFPYDADLLLNLANVYAQTHRRDDARALYRQVLARPNEDLTLADGRSESAHRIAAAALRRLSPEVIASR